MAIEEEFLNAHEELITNTPELLNKRKHGLTFIKRFVLEKQNDLINKKKSIGTVGDVYSFEIEEDNLSKLTNFHKHIYCHPVLNEMLNIHNNIDQRIFVEKCIEYIYEKQITVNFFIEEQIKIVKKASGSREQDIQNSLLVNNIYSFYKKRKDIYESQKLIKENSVTLEISNNPLDFINIGSHEVDSMSCFSTKKGTYWRYKYTFGIHPRTFVGIIRIGDEIRTRFLGMFNENKSRIDFFNFYSFSEEYEYFAYQAILSFFNDEKYYYYDYDKITHNCNGIASTFYLNAKNKFCIGKNKPVLEEVINFNVKGLNV